MGLRVGGPLLVEPARLLHDGGRLTEQDGIASQAEDKIDPASMGQHLEHLGGGKMAVATDEDMGLWPVPPQHRRGDAPRSWHFLAQGGACLGAGRRSPRRVRSPRK